MRRLKSAKKVRPNILPVVPVKETILFPKMVSTLIIDKSAGKIIEDLNNKEKSMRVVGILQQNDDDKFSEIGTAALVLDSTEVKGGNIKLSLQGIERFSSNSFIDSPYLQVNVSLVKDQNVQHKDTKERLPALVELFSQVTTIDATIPKEIAAMVKSIKNPSQISDMITASLKITHEEKYELLCTTDVLVRIKKLIDIMTIQIKKHGVSIDIINKTKKVLEGKQKEHYLRQQLIAIKKELGEEDDSDPSEEAKEYEEKIKAKDLPEEAEKEAMREIKRLKRVHPGAAERSVITTYLDWMIDLPWNEFSEENMNLKGAQQILDDDHYGLEKPKKRIVQYLAIKHLKDDPRGPILCFVGPPGTGKTSMGKSIANALGREFVRISLGGVRDEAEIRGHRRTYVGALPGRIIKGLKTAGTSNPVFMLDEIDKLGRDFRGDPSSALLEALDPEQNHSFSDHYLETPYDLSKVMFITTANTLGPIPAALKDRLDKIEFSGYTTYEKLKIAKQFLVPKQREEHGLKSKHISFTDAAISKVIHDYTYEAGVRNLERQIAEISRGVVADVVSEKLESVSINIKKVHDYLGKEKVPPPNKVRTMLPGMAIALFTDAHGGHVNFIETSILRGSQRKDKLILTGTLGDVLKESATIALSRLWAYNDSPDQSIHIHIPTGSMPKDGPSAGVALYIALASLFLEKPVKNDVAMTGEITLKGDVLPIGGVKEKALGAHRAGMKTLILPKWNKRDLDDVPQDIQDEMEFVFVDNVEEVLKIVLP
jgi:ATP-dependent Lon protease